MGDRIDITAPTAAICAALGLDPSDVARLNWSPGILEATVYLRNAEGQKYVDPEDQTRPAQEQRTYEVRA